MFTVESHIQIAIHWVSLESLIVLISSDTENSSKDTIDDSL